MTAIKSVLHQRRIQTSKLLDGCKRPTTEHHQERNSEKGPAAEDPSKMASGSTRYLRYILFAFFVCRTPSWWTWNRTDSLQGLAVLYFISSSSIPTQSLPGGADFKWPVKTNAHPPEAQPAPSSGEVTTKPATAEKGSTGEKVATGEKPTTGGSLPSEKEKTPNTAGGLPPAVDKGERMNATFVTLARNSDLWDIAKSIRNIEDRFNRKFNYDWVFLNDKDFDSQFKKVTTALISGKTHYGKIGPEHWSFPEFIDQDKARAVREDMAQRKIIYGDSVSYRHMCRFESGFFFQHPLMKQFEWYWRVEPSIELYCDINYDTFKFMRDNKKKYSFVLSLYEYVETIPTLWNSVKKFIKEHPEHIVEGNSMEWLSDDGGETYNHCHFVSHRLLG